MSFHILDVASPNHGTRPVESPTLVIVHGTAGTDAGDLDWMTRDDLPDHQRVSYHYLVQRTGAVYRLVDESRRAWHAGKSIWRGRADCNDYSIGLGFSNGGNGEPYTDEQYAAGGELLNGILNRQGLDFGDVVAHYHVSPGRKTDPWETFVWGQLFEAAL